MTPNSMRAKREEPGQRQNEKPGRLVALFNRAFPSLARTQRSPRPEEILLVIGRLEDTVRNALRAVFAPLEIRPLGSIKPTDDIQVIALTGDNPEDLNYNLDALTVFSQHTRKIIGVGVSREEAFAITQLCPGAKVSTDKERPFETLQGLLSELSQ